VTPPQLAAFHNAVQALAEAEPLCNPVLFKDNQRNHYNNGPRFGISDGADAI
jgi:beta-glucosidase